MKALQPAETVERRPVGVGASVVSISYASSAIAGGLTTLVVARLLGPTGAGAYSVVLATLAGLTILAALGLDTSALYHVGGRTWGAADALRQLQIAALVFGLAALGIGAALAGSLRDSAFRGVGPSTLILGLAALPFALSWSYGSAVALAREKYERAALPPVIQAIAGLLLTSAFAPWFGVVGAVSAITLAHAIAAVWFAARELRETRDQAKEWLGRAYSDLRTAIAFGYKSGLTRVMAVVNQRADVLILNAYAAQAAVGQYGVALSLTSIQLLLPSSLSRAVVPRVSLLRDQQTAHERSFVISKSAKHGVLISATAGVGMAIALLAVPAVFGSSFEPTVRLGWILVPGTAAYGVAFALSSAIVGSGYPEHILRASAIVTPITLGLYFVLIPRFGATGAAISSTLSYATTFVLYWLLFRRVSGISSLRDLLPGRDEILDYRSLFGRLRPRSDPR